MAWHRKPAKPATITCRLLFIISTHKLVVSRNCLSTRIFWRFFHRVIFYFEKFLAWIWRLPFAESLSVPPNFLSLGTSKLYPHTNANDNLIAKLFGHNWLDFLCSMENGTHIKHYILHGAERSSNACCCYRYPHHRRTSKIERRRVWSQGNSSLTLYKL